jgi:hypothetical protein
MQEGRGGTPRAPRLVVEVTADIIRDSVNRSSSHCMIAEAVRAAYPDASKVAIDIQTIRFSDNKKGFRYVYLTPRVAQAAIIHFDQGDLPQPYHFRLSGGQVTVAGRRPDARPLSEKEQAQREAASAAAAAKLKRGKLEMDWKTNSHTGGTTAVRTGGKPPPVSVGMRREFGIRGFDRLR